MVSRGSSGYPTYSSIQKALVNVGLGNVARDFATYEAIVDTSKPIEDYDKDLSDIFEPDPSYW